MVVVTYIYSRNERTQQMIDSFTRFGYEVAVVETDTHRGNGEALRLLYECYKRAATGHTSFMYADAADSFCQRKFFAPYDRIIYQTEKACYPHTWVASHYPEEKTKYDGSPWKFLNGGGYCGSPSVMVEFMERYGLNDLPSDCNGQHEQMVAYIDAKKDGFPIELDLGCELFQSMAFAEEDEFEVIPAFDFTKFNTGDTPTKHNVIKNKITNNVPAVLHFNGLTDMSILKELK